MRAIICHRSLQSKLPPMRMLLILIFLSVAQIITGQKDTAYTSTNPSRWSMKPVSPLKATIFSAVLPGAGQVYNGKHSHRNFLGKYWKVPLVYAGIGTCLAFIRFNTLNYQYYKKQYIASVDDNPGTIPEINASSESINRVQEQYHQWMDLSYICLAGVYILQIIEANVDAHLFYFDVSPDISLKVSPALFPGSGNPITGISLGISTATPKKETWKLH
jgi:hypothetical protein